ncbi:hypothetical protein [Stutzerimonas nitrititolerans]|uniref:hypothetical protein n=1 Tax=Stutzerimonas nitrititolerans TaxID=2482751 RepID=UPI0028A2B597|nr:hypothetical protein [Stutzerimonas nitrititolerans]
MQCPACNHIEDEAAFGSPLQCPSCGAYYEKAVVARAKKAEILYRAAERDERKRKIGAASKPVARSVSLSWSLLEAFFRSHFFARAVLVFAVVAGIVMLTQRGDEQPASARKAEPPNEYAINRVGQRAIEDRLKDAESARFRNQFVGPAGIPCGEVNAKNSFGAYNGFVRYVASGGGLAFMEGDMPDDQFEATWQKLCAR